jgi:lysophospholipase L1-like esterase
VGDDADFPGDAVVIWIGTNDVLQGGGAGPVAENIGKAVAELKGRTTKNTNRHEKGEEDLTTEDTESTEEEEGLHPGSRAGASKSDSLASKLADSPVSESPTRSASGPISSPTTCHSLLATAPEAQVFVLGIPPMATWVQRGMERNATIREINGLLAEGAKENGYQFIELESALADENGFLRGEMTSDGVHLSAKGYEAVLEKMKESGLF